MGDLRGILMLVGILPIERPNFNRKIKETNYDLVNKLNGKDVIIEDYHQGLVMGVINYDFEKDFEKYSLISENGKEINLLIHDIESLKAA